MISLLSLWLALTLDFLITCIKVSPFLNLLRPGLIKSGMKAETILMALVLTGIKLAQAEKWFLQSFIPDVCEIERKHITKKKEFTHLPISYFQGYLVKRSYNVFLQETALFPYFQTQQLILLSISIDKNIRWEKTSLYFPAACVKEPPWHAAPIQHCLLLCPVLKRLMKWSANAICLGLGSAGGWWGKGKKLSAPFSTCKNMGNCHPRTTYKHGRRQPPPSLRFGQFLPFCK